MGGKKKKMKELNGENISDVHSRNGKFFSDFGFSLTKWAKVNVNCSDQNVCEGEGCRYNFLLKSSKLYLNTQKKVKFGTFENKLKIEVNYVGLETSAVK